MICQQKLLYCARAGEQRGYKTASTERVKSVKKRKKDRAGIVCDTVFRMIILLRAAIKTAEEASASSDRFTVRSFFQEMNLFPRVWE